MQIKQTWKGYISIAVVALVFLAPKIANAQFVGNPLIPMEGKVIVYTNDAKGGHHQVATIAARDLISLSRRQPGMLCTVMDDGTGKPKTYQLICADNEAALGINTNWVVFGQTSGGGATGDFNGSRPITGQYYTGVNPGTDDLAKWIEAVFYPSLGPSATLTASPSGTIEMGAGGNTSVTLSWSASRALQTEAITEIVVNGQNVFGSSPAAGASVTGSVTASIPATGSKTFTMSVKTSDNKTATTTAGISFQYKRYWGFVSGGADGASFTPGNAQILALSGSAFATGPAVSNLSATPSGPQKLVIAYPASFGGSKITVGVNDSTGAFDKLTQSFTNASGGTTSYTIWIQKDNTAAGLTFSVQ